MKIFELISAIESYSVHNDRHIINDGVKVGDINREITGVGLTMFPSTNVIRKAKELGINFLIAHEPLIYGLENVSYNSDDFKSPHKISVNKINMLENYGITLYRYNDYAHAMAMDIFIEGFIKYLGLDGQVILGDFNPSNFKNYSYVLDKPLTAKELAKYIEKNLGLKHVRIAGCHNRKGTKVSFCFGIGKNIIQEMRNNDFVITGELSEFIEAELAHDYAEQGYNKALLILGHYGTEVSGIRLLSEKLATDHKNLLIKYLECGDTYRYTESI